MFKIRVRIVICCSLLYCCGVSAEEPVGPFLNGLRSRGYFDIALQYIDGLESQQLLPQSVREILPLERGIILQQSAENAPHPEEQQRRLQSAAELFAQFLHAAPDHPLAPQARTLLAEVQLEQARCRIREKEQLKPSPDQLKFWQEVREQVQDLRGFFVQLRDQYQARCENYPAYIPDEEQELRLHRNRVQEMLIRTLLDLAQCTYWEAHTYPPGSAARQELLTKAGVEYEAIHQRFRSQVGGLYARLWQGKCYEELQDEQGIRLALGIYGEILEHDGTSGVLIRLKDLALRFRLICLNTDFRRDYQLVEMEAEDWLEAAGARAELDVGRGIEWELCRSLEFLSQDLKWAPDTRRDYLERARSHAEHLSLLPGEQSFAAKEMLKRTATAP